MDRTSFENAIDTGLLTTNEVYTTTSAGAVAPAWEQPIPFEDTKAPDFPVDCLPGPVRDYVNALSISTQTPPEMAGILSLGVLATCPQSKLTLQITRDWKEPLCLYTMAIAPPAERKSAVLSGLLAPVYQYETERRKAEAVEVEQSRAKREMLEQRLIAEKSDTHGPQRGKT